MPNISKILNVPYVMLNMSIRSNKPKMTNVPKIPKMPKSISTCPGHEMSLKAFFALLYVCRTWKTHFFPLLLFLSHFFFSLYLFNKRLIFNTFVLHLYVYLSNEKKFASIVRLVAGRPSSVTRCRVFFNIWPFPSRKICSIAYKIAKIGHKCCQILNLPSKNCQRLLRFCQSGEISPNLVTLII